MEFPLCVPMYIAILILGCEGGPYFNKDKTLSNGYDVSWMKNIDDETLLSALTIPGTYQSMKMNIYDKHQVWKFPVQFKAGVRFFDISLTDSVVKDGSTKDREFSEVMKKMEECVTSQNQEVILIRVNPTNDKAAEVLKTYIRDSDKVYTGTAVPKLKEVRGKIVFLASDFNGGLVAHTLKGGQRLKSINKNMEKIKENLEKAENANGFIVVTETSALKMNSNQNAAKEINPMLHKVINDMHLKESKRHMGVIVMDFPGLDLIQKIIDINPKSVSPTSSAEVGEGENPENPPEGEEEDE
ncbi:1-phosphatidylinositol phosphodiesterase-like [Conger conger]|uniref:1-phosphatidylinositol phosphodiesterase-like n=1 Tax=Conger conger TaxID=82655 RepID=UPI002A59AEB5|nr:1-phosphatidylinositol phosphodiesterase-like [Conger conger]